MFSFLYFSMALHCWVFQAETKTTFRMLKNKSVVLCGSASRDQRKLLVLVYRDKTSKKLSVLVYCVVELHNIYIRKNFIYNPALVLLQYIFFINRLCYFLFLLYVDFRGFEGSTGKGRTFFQKKNSLGFKAGLKPKSLQIALSLVQAHYWLLYRNLVKPSTINCLIINNIWYQMCLFIGKNGVYSLRKLSDISIT